MKNIKENSAMKHFQKHQLLTWGVILLAALFIALVWIIYNRQGRLLEREIYLLK